MRSLVLGSAASVLGLGCGSPQSAPANAPVGAAPSAASAAAATPAPVPAKATTLALPGGSPDGVVSRDGHVYLANSKASELVVVGP
jgi:hypothetical protein